MVAPALAGPCTTDTNGDGTTDVDDLVNVILCWDTNGIDCPDAGDGTDIDDNGVVNVDDLVELIIGWGVCAIDTNPPDITCPDELLIECSDSNTPDLHGWAMAVDDIDPDPSIMFSDDVVPGFCQGAATITRTWTATDAAGNSAQCVQIIDVVDTTPPVLSVPPAVFVKCGKPLGIEATAFDDCGQPQIGAFDTSKNICNEVYTIFWTATDPCGNASFAQTQVTVGN